MKTIVFAARRYLSRAGWPGIFGLAILLGSPLFYATMVLPKQEQLAMLRGEQRQLRREISARPGTAVSAPTMETQLKKFYGQLPALNSSDELLKKIYAAAERQNIALESGAYRLTETEPGNIRRYQITLPIKGNHVQIRRFLTDILAEIPAMSLDDISYKREAISLPGGNAVIKLTLFLGNPA